MRRNSPEVSYSVSLNQDQSRLLAHMHRSGRFEPESLNYSNIIMGGSFLASFEWSRDKGMRLARSLYGILGLTQRKLIVMPWIVTDESRRYAVGEFGSFRPNSTRYETLFVPDSNEDAAEGALNTNEFTKSFLTDDLRALIAIYERTQELRDLYGNNFSPRFFEKEVARRSELPMDSMRERLGRLEGLICRSEQVSHGAVTAEGFKSRLHPDDNFVVRNTRPKWFLPNSRVSDVEELLDRYPRDTRKTKPKLKLLKSEPGVNTPYFKAA